jgi:hypothetical protein
MGFPALGLGFFFERVFLREGVFAERRKAMTELR